MSNSNTTGKQETMTALTVANILMGLLIATFAGIFLYIELADAPAPDPEMTEQYVAVARERLAEHSDVVEQELMALVSETVPPISDAVYAQTRRDFPKYVNVLERQGKVLMENVEQIFLTQVKAQYHDYLAVHRDVLRQEFPEYASDKNVDRVMNEFEETFNRIVERYYLEELRREANETAALWAAIEPLPTPAPGEPSLEEQLADYSSDWTMLALNEPGNASSSSSQPPQ